jgi:hypothetical protein
LRKNLSQDFPDNPETEVMFLKIFSPNIWQKISVFCSNYCYI